MQKIPGFLRDKQRQIQDSNLRIKFLESYRDVLP
jgi:hypothetical protein